MKYIIKSLLCLILLGGLNISHAQHPYFYSINEENGLPVNEIYKIAQDDFGYIWIGCDAGLYRYDGFNFKLYRNSLQNGRSISSLSLDKKNQLWCRNFSGQNFVLIKDSLHIVSNKNQSFSLNNLFAIDDQSQIWMIDQKHLIQRDVQGTIKYKFKLEDPEFFDERLNSIYFYKNAVYLSYKGVGLFQFDVKSHQLTPLKINPNDNIINTNVSFFEKNGVLYAFSNFEFHSEYSVYQIINDELTNIKKYQFKKDFERVYELVVDRTDQIWICTSDGLRKLDEQFNLGNQIIFKGKHISNLFIDRENLYWVSSLQEGIFVIPSMEVKIYDVLNSSLIAQAPLALRNQSNQSLYMGFQNGEVYHMDLKTFAIDKVKVDNEIKKISVKKINEINQNIMVAHGPLSYLDQKSKVLKSLLFFNLRDFAMYKDSLMFITNASLGIISYSDLMKGKKENSKTILQMGGRNIYVGSDHSQAYIILNGGLYHYANGRIQEIKYLEKSIYASSISGVEDEIYIGTISSGILVIKNNEVFKAYNSSNSIIENDIKSIVVNDRYIWASSNEMVYRIDRKTGVLNNMTQSMGIHTRNIQAIELTDNIVYFAGNKRLISFPQDINMDHSIQPTLKISSAAHNAILYNNLQSIQLPYKNSNFSITLSSISMRSKGDYEYQYRISGLDTNWKTIPASNPEIVFNSIPSGKYLFEAKVKSDVNTYSDIVQLNIEVELPIWKSWWFYLICTALLLLVVGIIYYWNIQSIKKSAAIDNKLTASQLTALKAQMNPHFMYNALNSIQEFVIQHDVKNSNFYLSKFSGLMRKVLDASSAESITLQREYEMLNDYLVLEKLRFGDEFIFEIDMAKDLDSEHIHIPPMIIQPFVENAIKHGLLHQTGVKKLNIRFYRDQQLICEVIDNGIGRQRAAEIKSRQAINNPSFATQATVKRIELLNNFTNTKCKFEITDLELDGKAMGTKVVIWLPNLPLMN